MAIILKRRGQKAQVIEKTAYSAELDLQRFIYANPELLPIADIKQGVEFLVLDKETPTRSGPIDLLGVDSDGEIYIVETKLFRNADKRKALAQVLDYGAALWSSYQDPEAFLRMLNQRASQAKRDLDRLLEDRFGSAEEVLDGMRETISSGAFRFVILMDAAPPDLKELVRYVNRSSTFSVYVVELQRYGQPDHDLEIFVPQVFGEEVRKEVRDSSLRQRWDETSFFGDLEEKVDPETAAAVRRLYEYSKARADVVKWGTGSSDGSFNPRFLTVADKSLYTVYSNGRLTFNFGWLTDAKAKAVRDRLWAGLKGIPRLAQGVPELVEKSPRFPAQVWVPVCDQLLDLLDQVLADATSSEPAPSA